MGYLNEDSRSGWTDDAFRRARNSIGLPGGSTPGGNTGGVGTGGTGGTGLQPISGGRSRSTDEMFFQPGPAQPGAPAPKPMSFNWIQQQNQAARQEALKTLESGLGGLTSGLDQFTADYIKMLSDMEARQAEELSTQVGEGRTSIDEATQRAMQEVVAAGNPYANLRMAEMPDVENPLAMYMSDSGASGRAVNQLSQVLNAGNAGANAAFRNLAQILGASTQASSGGRAVDVQLARAAALRDLEANRRALGFQISSGRNLKEMEQRRAANEAARAAALQGLQQRLAIGQTYDQQQSQLVNTLLQVLASKDANWDFKRMLGIGGL